MVDLAPIKQRLASAFAYSTLLNERMHALTERALESISASWTDLGDWIEHSYSEDEMREIVAIIRKEGVEAGIKIGEARQQSNGHIVLPEPAEMKEYCHQRPNRLKDHAQREFIDEMYVKTRRGMNLQRGTLGEHLHQARRI